MGQRLVWIYIHAPLNICIERDPKGLYRKARAGEITHFTGVDSPYEEPLNPDLVVDTASHTLDESITILNDFMKGYCLLSERSLVRGEGEGL